MTISGFKKSAREYIFKNAPKLFIITIIYLAIITLLQTLSTEVSGINNVLAKLNEQLARRERPDLIAAMGQYRPFGSILYFAITLFTPVVVVGNMSYCLKISRGQDGDYRNLFDGFAMFGKIMLLTLLMGIFVFLWSLLFIIPGIIAIYKYSQAYFILLDNPEMSAMDCIRESKRIMDGNKLDLFILQLSFIGWSILNVLFMRYVIALPLVSIWLTPYMTITNAGFYNYLIRYNPEAGKDAAVL